APTVCRRPHGCRPVHPSRLRVSRLERALCRRGSAVPVQRVLQGVGPVGPRCRARGGLAHRSLRALPRAGLSTMAHDHDHPHDHGPGDDAIARENALRAEALESLLVERGIVRPELIDAIVERFERDIGPLNGARLVARAWTDPAFRARALHDVCAAARELGVPTGPETTLIRAVENTG